MSFRLPFNDDLYVTFGETVLTNASFNNILDYCGPRSWMTDDMLDAALAALRISLNCDANRIGFVKTTDAQMCVMASNSEEPEDWITNYGSGWQNKKWLFVPINDGMHTGTRGTHWSLVVVDRLHNTGFFYDSFNMHREAPSHVAAEVVTKGLARILGDAPYSWWPQERTPDQYRNNHFGGNVWSDETRTRVVWRCWDDGPCGPFVWKMTQHLVREIRGYQARDEEHRCSLNIFNEQRFLPFRDAFHTYRIRSEIMVLIASFVSGPDSNALARELHQVVAGNTPAIMEHHDLWFAGRSRGNEDLQGGGFNSCHASSDTDKAGVNTDYDDDTDEGNGVDEDAGMGEDTDVDDSSSVYEDAGVDEDD
jgi:hypothetical protein